MLGAPVEPLRGEREMFFDGFFVDYDEAGRVEFIELGRSARYRVTFLGIALHEVPADQAVALISTRDVYDPYDPEPGYSYVFLGLQLSLWRSAVPDPNQPASDPDGRHFEAVGVACPGYFTAGEPS